MTSASTYQERYWSELVSLRTHVYYIHLYQVELERTERRLNVALAVTSSGSLGAWALSQSLPFLWTFLIVAAQVITAVRQHLPFEKRLRQAMALGSSLDEIALFAERKWYAVSEGELDNSEIHELAMDIKRQKLSAEREHVRSSPLPERPELLRQAEAKAVTYFRNFYNVDAHVETQEVEPQHQEHLEPSGQAEERQLRPQGQPHLLTGRRRQERPEPATNEHPRSDASGEAA